MFGTRESFVLKLTCSHHDRTVFDSHRVGSELESRSRLVDPGSDRDEATQPPLDSNLVTPSLMEAICHFFTPSGNVR